MNLRCGICQTQLTRNIIINTGNYTRVTRQKFYKLYIIMQKHNQGCPSGIMIMLHLGQQIKQQNQIPYLGFPS